MLSVQIISWRDQKRVHPGKKTGGGSRALEVLAEGEILIARSVHDLVLLRAFLAVLFLLVGRSLRRCSSWLGRGDRRSVNRRSRDRDNFAGRGTSVDGDAGYGGRTDAIADAEHLAEIDVGALGVDLRVVAVEDGAVDTVVVPDSAAGVAVGDGVGVGAVFTFGSEADGLAGDEVAAGRVDLAGVHSSQLVGGHIVCGRDAVANVAFLDSVGASASSSKGHLCNAGNGKKAGGVSEHCSDRGGCKDWKAGEGP